MADYSLATLGRTGNLGSPYGANGPQYDLRLANGMGLGVGGEAELWYQGLRAPYTLFRQAERQREAQQAERTAGAIQPNRYQVPVPFSDQTINPNDPYQRYQAVNIVRSPEIAEATRRLMQTFSQASDAGLADFGSYLDNFRSQVGTAATRSAAATDIGPLASSLRTQQGRYSGALDRSAQEYADLNARTAAEERGIVDQANRYLPEYDAAMDRAAAVQRGLLQQQVSRYKAGSGTPRSLGSSELRQLAAGAAAIQVPLEQAKIGQRYNILSQYAMPVALDLANRETQRIANFNPMVAAQQFQTGQATEQTVQQLAMVTANMSYDNATRYMTALSVPFDVQQRILSGQIGQLGGLNQLYQSSRYQGLQDRMGANITPAVGYSMALPGYSSSLGRYGGVSPTSGTGTAPSQTGQPYAAPGSPRYAPAGAQGDWQWDAGNQRWQNWRTGDTSSTGPWQYNQGAGRYVNVVDNRMGYTPPENLMYDPAFGQNINLATMEYQG